MIRLKCSRNLCVYSWSYIDMTVQDKSLFRILLFLKLWSMLSIICVLSKVRTKIVLINSRFQRPCSSVPSVRYFFGIGYQQYFFLIIHERFRVWFSKRLQHATLKSISMEADLERNWPIYLLKDPLGKYSTNSVTQCWY